MADAQGLIAAYVTQMQRVHAQNTRGIATPEHRTAWSKDAIAVLDSLKAEAWDEGYNDAANFHEGREKGHWENDYPSKGMRTWRPDPAPTNPYREEQS